MRHGESISWKPVGSHLQAWHYALGGGCGCSIETAKQAGEADQPQNPNGLIDLGGCGIERSRTRMIEADEYALHQMWHCILIKLNSAALPDN